MASAEDHWNKLRNTRERAILRSYEVKCLVSRFIEGFVGVSSINASEIQSM